MSSETGRCFAARLPIPAEDSFVLANLPTIASAQIGVLGGHLKTGHRGSPQNRPTGRGQDMRLLYRVGGRRGKTFLI